MLHSDRNQQVPLRGGIGGLAVRLVHLDDDDG